MNKIILGLLLLVLAFAACKPKPQQVIVQTQNKSYYTCSMHPQVHEDHPGNCPICGMKLIKVELTGNNKTSDKITLTATQLQLADIQTDTVREAYTGLEKTLTGTVTTDETRATELSARTAGRIQQLLIRTVGEKISAGQPVYILYSEDLQEAEKEYLLAKQQQKLLHNPDVDYGQLISSAESKLQLWGLTLTQIKNLAASGKTSATTTILSKISGTVSDKTANYKENDLVSIAFPDLNGQVLPGKVEFINPELSDASKVDLIRISIPNPQGLIRPGMQAYISIGKGGNRSLAVAASAVLADGKGSKVWVKNQDGSFSPKMVEIGSGNQAYAPVISGLNEGDIVVTNGAYLLNSEAIFKNGSDNMAGMKM
jgi:Cu(I)/Ag(I) efflux system membrane fusion protein